MPAQRVISEVAEGTLGVENPVPGLRYYWHTPSCGNGPIREGTTFVPGSEAMDYWVSAWWAAPLPEPIDLSEYLRRKWMSTANLESKRTKVSWDGMNTNTLETAKEASLQLAPNPCYATAERLWPANGGGIDVHFYRATPFSTQNQYQPTAFAP